MICTRSTKQVTLEACLVQRTHANHYLFGRRRDGILEIKNLFRQVSRSGRRGIERILTYIICSYPLNNDLKQCFSTLGNFKMSGHQFPEFWEVKSTRLKSGKVEEH